MPSGLVTWPTLKVPFKPTWAVNVTHSLRSIAQSFDLGLQATHSINIELPYMCYIRLTLSLSPVAAAFVRFAPPDIRVKVTAPLAFRPYGEKRKDLLASKLPWLSTCAENEIINKLSGKVKM